MTGDDLALFDLPPSPSAVLGERIKTARERAGLSKVKLAEAMGKSPKAVVNWESGSSGMHERTLERLCEVLGFPRQFFSASQPLPQVSPPNFRVAAGTPQYQRARFTSFASTVGLILEQLQLDPDTALRRGRLELSEVQRPSPEVAAVLIRRHVSPDDQSMVDVVAAAESLGVFVVFGPPEVSQIDAYSMWVADHPLIVLNPAKHDSLRLRFDVAHELGHLVLHRAAETPETSGSLREREAEADRFARAFLIPPSPAFSAKLERAIRTYGLDALAQLQSNAGVAVRDLCAFASKRLPKLGDLIRRRITEWNGWAGRPTGAEANTEVPALLPRLLSETAAGWGTDAEQFGFALGVPTDYVRMITRRQPTPSGVDPHRGN